MAKGFSFVLVTVVMVVMLVFGLLSVSSSAANMRLANKAANAQVTYYDLDSKGERLVEQCALAASAAQRAADQFIENKSYAGKLPDDLFACLKPPAAQAASSDAARQTLKRGLFFYYLSQGLKKEGLAAAADQKALSSALTGKELSTPIVTVNESIKSESNSRCSLQVSLTFAASDAPAYKRAKWLYAVQSPDISGEQHLNVWQGN